VNVTAAKVVVYGGAGNNTINLGSNTAQTRIMLQQGGVDQINGFNLHNGDVLDFSTLLAETRVSLADLNSLGTYLQVSASGTNATLSYNPAGLAAGGGAAVAVLHGVGTGITLGTLISDNVLKIS